MHDALEEKNTPVHPNASRIFDHHVLLCMPIYPHPLRICSLYIMKNIHWQIITVTHQWTRYQVCRQFAFCHFIMKWRTCSYVLHKSMKFSYDQELCIGLIGKREREREVGGGINRSFGRAVTCMAKFLNCSWHVFDITFFRGLFFSWPWSMVDNIRCKVL